ncbi:prolipoprotein diacylglyceryl transferase [Mycoplasmopsis synoviae]|uniref:prolipoprotein diacylglyceryl transferase n=1 Tax=Mycoplasmopsis synoviae TaxID=2109 RepID=UPI0035660DD6
MNNPKAPAYVFDTAFPEGASTILFKIGSYEFHLYSLMLMLGILCSILTIIFFWNRAKISSDILIVFIMITIPTSLIGARLGFVFESLIYHPETLQVSKWYAIWNGGLSIQGGVLLAMIADVIYAYRIRLKIDMRKVASIIIPTILIGQFVGRWGNYVNHEVYGKIDWDGHSVLIFGKDFARNMYISDTYSASLGLQGAYRYPLFLYEALLNLTGYLLIVWVFNLFGLFKPGVTSGMYLAWYGVVRLAMEPLRQEAFLFYSLLAIFFTLTGLVIMVYYQFFNRVKYYKIKRKYYYDYLMVDLVKYNQWVQKTSYSALFYAVFSFFQKNVTRKLIKK